MPAHVVEHKWLKLESDHSVVRQRVQPKAAAVAALLAAEEQQQTRQLEYSNSRSNARLRRGHASAAIKCRLERSARVRDANFEQ